MEWSWEFESIIKCLLLIDMHVQNSKKYKSMKKLLICLAGSLFFSLQMLQAQEAKKDWDTRWFLAPLSKFQVQEFGMLEKDRLGYLSDANTLSLRESSTMSFAVSAYKNLTGRLSMSLDLGLGNGHVTSPQVQISQTEAKTYNLVNATLYYHLLNAHYRLQPYMFAGINGLVNDASYTSAPAGVGVKLNSKKFIVLAQAGYGFPVSKTIANTMVYSAGFYLAINSKKKKKALQDSVDNSTYNNWSKDSLKKNDTTSKKGAPGTVVNNFYITVKMDSLQNAKKKENGDASDNNDPSGHQNGGTANGSGTGLQVFDREDSKADTVNGRPVVKFVVYFQFNEYALTTQAFGSVDKIVYQMRKNKNLVASINGYTDDVGTTEFNNFLSRRRAKMVFDYMNSQGIPSDRMDPKFFGKENPVAPNDNPNTAWLNRRVEIMIAEK
jgi:outer membrane protein OmpA-like peptidoglycan-associated protein